MPSILLSPMSMALLLFVDGFHFTINPFYVPATVCMWSQRDKDGSSDGAD